MTFEQTIKCNMIIHAASIAAGAVGAGLAQVPCGDNAIITPIQIGMIISLGKVFNRQVSESAAMSSILSITAYTIGRGASQVLIGWIPGAGNLTNAATAASITEAIGWLIAEEFDEAA